MLGLIICPVFRMGRPRAGTVDEFPNVDFFHIEAVPDSFTEIAEFISSGIAP